jgi:hypothetical protein
MSSLILARCGAPFAISCHAVKLRFWVTKGNLVKRTLVFSILLIVAVSAFASQSARADELTLAGTTSSLNPLGITFAVGSFSGTTSGGFAGFSNLGSFTLSSGAGTYTGGTVSLTVVFTLRTGIAGGGSSIFVANLFGNVNTNAGRRGHRFCELFSDFHFFQCQRERLVHAHFEQRLA